MQSLVERLVERQEIADLLARFCERIDEYDIDGVVELFTDDCTTDYGPGRGGAVLGREAFRARLLSSQGAFRRTHHQLGQVRVELDGDSARSVAYVTADHELSDGQRETVRFQYRDRFTRQSASWRIVERQALATVVDSDIPRERNWVPRRKPNGA